MKKLMAFLLLVAMACSVAVACGGDGSINGTVASDTSADTNGVTADVTDAVTTDDIDSTHSLPADLKFAGEELILATYSGGNVGHGWANYLDIDAPEAGNSIQEAAYNRNQEVERMLGITITCNSSDWVWLNGLTIALDVCTRSGNSIYDIMYLESIFSYEQLIIDELLMDVAKMPYVDLNKSYYNKQFNDVYYLRDNLYLFASDTTFPCQSAVKWLVNDDRMVDLGYERDYLFHKVESGDWNLSVVWDMIEGVAIDVNNDGIEDDNDIYGIGSNCWQLAPLYPATGLKGCYYTEDGFEFDYGTEYSITVFNAILDLQNSPDVKFDGDNDVWYLGNALFTVSGGPIHDLRLMEFDFSVLPMPRFNEEQDRYYNFCSGGVSIVPATVANENLVGASIEAMAWASAKHLVPAFHDDFIEQGVLRNNESWNNWNRMLGEWAAPEFCNLISPDGRLVWFKPVYDCLWFNDPGFAESWDAMKDSVAETCWIFYEFYLADLGA